MLSRWSDHISDPKERESLELAIRNSSTLLRRLRQIIDEDIAGLLSQERVPSVYDHPSWSHKQAHTNGRLHELARLKDLLTL